MPNYLDFLLVLDRYVRESSDGCVRAGYEMHEIAHEAGLVERDNEVAANWAGILVEQGYLTHEPLSMGDRGPVLPGRMWNNTQVQRFHDYRLTAQGREEADRLRREKRETQTSAALGSNLPHLIRPWMSESQRGAISEPVVALQAALDSGRAGEAIGAAKDLLEAACKILMERAGQPVTGSPSLPTLFKQTLEAVEGDPSVASELGRSLIAVVQRLAELRNAAGAGHGRAVVPDRSTREALLAASAATGLAAFLMEAE